MLNNIIFKLPYMSSIEEETKGEIPHWLERETKESDEIYAKNIFEKLTKEFIIKSSSDVLSEELCKKCIEQKKNEKKQKASLMEETRLTDIAEDEAIALSLMSFEEHRLWLSTEDEAIARSLQEQEEIIQRQIQLDFEYASKLK